MKYLLAVFITIACSISALYAQIKFNPAYQKITLISYVLAGAEKYPNVELRDVMEITGHNMHRLTKTYKGICDTTYQLEAISINLLNQVFNGKRLLKSYQKTTKMDGRYGGYPSLLTYTDNQGRLQKLLVVNPFMDDDFMKTYDAMTRFPFPVTVKYKGDKIINESMEHEVLSAYKQASYIPKTEAPPMMSPLN